MTHPTAINLIYHSIVSGGGMERYVTCLLEGFVKKNIYVHVITRVVDDDIREKFSKFVEFIIIPDLGFLGRYENIRFEFLAINFIRPNLPTLSISRTYGKVDVVIKGGTHRGHLKFKKKILPSIYDIVTSFLETAIFKSAKLIVAHSECTKKEIINLYDIPDSKVIVLYPPIDTEIFNIDARKDRLRIRQELGLTSEDFAILFPSNDHKRKGAKLIINALNHLESECKLYVAGKSPLSGKNVVNLGYRTDIEKLYAAFDAVILASAYEPFGLVGPEAVLCGTKVLMAKGIGCTEVLSEESCTQFDRTPSSLIEAIKSMKNKRNSILLNQPIDHLKIDPTITHHIENILSKLS